MRPTLGPSAPRLPRLIPSAPSLQSPSQAQALNGLVNYLKKVFLLWTSSLAIKLHFSIENLTNRDGSTIKLNLISCVTGLNFMCSRCFPVRPTLGPSDPLLPRLVPTAPIPQSTSQAQALNGLVNYLFYHRRLFLQVHYTLLN